MGYRILSLDGGGSWALLQVAALARLHGETASGHDILSRYDLVAANSGGSIVLAGLIENFTLRQIDALFQDEANRRMVFAPTGSLIDWLIRRLGIGPKYNADKKLVALKKLMPNRGGQQLSRISPEIPRGPGGEEVRFLIVGFDYDMRRAAFFRSHSSGAIPGFGAGRASDLSVAEAVHASTNAPINFFDAPARYPGKRTERYWDGAITGYNNPCLAAVTEAICCGRSLAELRVLSIGTGGTLLPLAKPNTTPAIFETPIKESSLLEDVKKVAGSILDDPPDSASFIVHALTGGALAGGPPGKLQGRIVRLNPLIRPFIDSRTGRYVPPPGWTEPDFQRLAALDMDAVAQGDVDLINRLKRSWIDDDAPINQPIRIRSGDLAAEIGDQKFSEAIQHWARLCGLP